MVNKRVIDLKTLKNLIKKCCKKLYYICKAILKKILLLFPINKNKIVFDNFAGQGYAGNPKYIADELLKRKLDYELVWFLNDMTQNVPEGIKKVKYGSIRSLYEYATAKVIVDNIRNAHLTKKRKGQIYLQTWHGTRPLKYIEKDAIEKLDSGYIKSAMYDGSIIDGITSDSKMQDDSFKRAFWLNENAEILRFGIPRNDIFMRDSEFVGIKQKVGKYFGIDNNKFIVLYAPTFRDDKNTDSYIKNFKNIIKAFESKMNKECVVLVRLHPNEKDNIHEWKFDEKMINASGYPDGQELVIYADCVISDYSSIIFDFLLLKKYIFLYSNDIDEYTKLRGLSKDYFELPFPRVNTTDDLIKCIESFDEHTYLHTIEDYEKDYPSYNDGNATKNITNWIIEKMK